MSKSAAAPTTKSSAGPRTGAGTGFKPKAAAPVKDIKQVWIDYKKNKTEPLRNTPLLTIDGACIGSREEGEAAFAPLLEIGEPIMNTFDQVPPATLCRIHMDPEQPVPGLGHHRVLRELPDEAIDVFASMADADSGTPLLLTEIRHMGGALSRPAENGGALSHLDAEFAMFGIGMPMTRSWARRSKPTTTACTRRWSRGQPTAATSTSPSAPATPTRSSRPRSAPASPR